MNEDSAGTARFEVPDLASAVRLMRRLGPAWNASLTEREEINVVSADIRSAPRDLAVLLREVEGWVAEESLCAIRFELDGRDYVLEAGGPDWGTAEHALSYEN